MKSGTPDAAIQNAILDFSGGNSIYKNDSVFSINYLDTLYRMVLNKSKGDYTWEKGEPYERIVAVAIRSNSNRFLLTTNTTIGSKGKLPSRFIEKDRKLFFWWDNEYALTEEALSIYKKYGLLQDDQGGIITVPDFINDDSKKAVHYYFCRNNLTKYKKISTAKGIGYYDPPSVHCE